MNNIYLIITILSLVTSLIGWLVKLRWSNEFIKAKEAEKQALQSQLNSKDEALRVKDELIKMKEHHIEELNSLNPSKLKEYYNVVKAELIEYNDKLKKELENNKTELSAAMEKLNSSRSAENNSEQANNELITKINSLKESIDSLKQITSYQSVTIEKTKQLYADYYKTGPNGYNKPSSSDIISMLTLIKLKTSYLWKALANSTPDQDVVKADIRETTLNLVSDSLKTLQANGYMKFNTRESYITDLNGGEMVYLISVTDIQPALREYINVVKTATPLSTYG